LLKLLRSRNIERLNQEVTGTLLIDAVLRPADEGMRAMKTRTMMFAAAAIGALTACSSQGDDTAGSVAANDADGTGDAVADDGDATAYDLEQRADGVADAGAPPAEIRQGEPEAEREVGEDSGHP
jgi:hypothetical protein